MGGTVFGTVFSKVSSLGIDPFFGGNPGIPHWRTWFSGRTCLGWTWEGGGTVCWRDSGVFPALKSIHAIFKGKLGPSQSPFPQRPIDRQDTAFRLGKGAPPPLSTVTSYP